MTRFPFLSLTPALLALGFLTSPIQASEGWETDFAAAKKAAAEQKKDLLIDFTGSDWCGWCKKLDKEVFSEAAFKESATKNFILVSLDFPHHVEQKEELKKQNQELAEKWEIQGFPTIMLADSTGKPYAQTGYQEGGAAAYLKHLDELIKTRSTRDEKFAAAAKAEGVAKAKLLKEGIDALGADVADKFYASTVEEVIALDKDDSLGLKKDHEMKKASKGLMEAIQKLDEDGKKSEIPGKIDAFIAEHKIEGKRKQELNMAKLGAFIPEDMDGAVKVLDGVIAMDDKSEMAEEARGVKKKIAAFVEQQKAAAKDGGEKDGGDKPKGADKAPAKKSD